MTQDQPEGDPAGGGGRLRSCLFCGSVCVLCVAFSLLATILFFSIIFVVLEIPHGLQTVTLRGLIVEVFYRVLAPGIIFVGEITKSLFPWPIVALLGLFLIGWGPDRIREILASANLEFPGFKFRGGAAAPDAFKREMGDAQRVVESANKEIAEAYRTAKTYVAQLRDSYGIDRLVGELSAEVAQALGPSCPDDYRFTVYVPDLVFSDRLYQLSEYYDSNGRRMAGERAGRTFSIRYGIIGRVWRSGVPEVEGELISAEDWNLIGENYSVRDLEKFIARRWGLTLDEAVKIRPYQSYGSIRIERGDKPLGLVFFDSKQKDAFNSASLEAIDEIVQDSDLAVTLLEISREIGQWSRIQIFRNS